MDQSKTINFTKLIFWGIFPCIGGIHMIRLKEISS